MYDFDRCTGALNNLKVLPFGDPHFFGFATVFAPDSRHLYLSSWETLTVLDLKASDIGASFDTLACFDGKATPQQPFSTGFFNPNLAPDGKIYYATTNSTLSLHVIHHPNLDGHAADVEQHGITLPKFNDGTMCIFPNYRLGQWIGSPCDTIPVHRPGFEPTNWYPPFQRKIDGYTLLPALCKKNALLIDMSAAQKPSIIELAIERRKEKKKKHPGAASPVKMGKGQ
jgi:hypothetical protein